MANLFQPSINRVTDETGAPASGARMSLYLSGSLIPATYFLDQAGTVAGTNPQIADADGIFRPIYLDPDVTYRISCVTADESETLFDVDPVRGFDETQLADLAAQVAADSAAAEAAAAEAAADLLEIQQLQNLVAAMQSSVPYPNAYAATLPKGVTSTTITNAGSGYTPATYALGVSGGPTGFAGTYTVESGGTVASIAITNPGLSTSSSAPTLSFPSGGGTGAAATATVGSLVANQRAYAVASSDSATIQVFYNNAGSVAPLNNPDGSQISYPQINGLPILVAKAFPHYVTPPPFGSYLLQVGTPYIFESVNGVPITLPANFGVRRLGRSGNLFNMYIDSFDGVSTYAVMLGVALNGSSLDVTGYTGWRDVPLVVRSGSVFPGIPNGTVVGSVPINFLPTGASFGNAGLDIAWSAGALQPLQTRPSIAFTTQVESIAADVIANTILDSPIVGDEYLQRLIPKIGIQGGELGERYLLNYETAWFSGIQLARIQFWLRDIDLGVNIATRGIAKTGPTAQADVLAEFKDKLFMCNVAQGSILANYKGIGCHIWIDKSQIDWTKTTTTTYTTYAQSGVKEENVATPEMLKQFRYNQTPHQYITYGNADADFPTKLQAIESIVRPDILSTYTRSSYPLSDETSFFNQIAFLNLEGPGYEEEVNPYFRTGLSFGLVIPDYAVCLFNGATFYVDTDPNLGTVVERPWNSYFERGAMDQRLINSSYCSHEDILNSLARRSTVAGDPDTVIRCVQDRIDGEGMRYIADDNCATSALRGCGMANASATISHGTEYIRRGNTPGWDMYFAHTSPGTVEGGLIEHTNCFANDASYGSGCAAVSLLKSHAMTVEAQHTVVVDNCNFERIENGNSVDAVSAFKLAGRCSTTQPAPASLEPTW